MAKISIRNLTYIKTKDFNLGQAMDDLVNHISIQQQTIEFLKSQLATLQKKVGS